MQNCVILCDEMEEKKDNNDLNQPNVIEWILKINEQCEHLNTLMANQIHSKEQLINRLHDELDYYKKETATKFENQLLKEIIRIRQDMKRKLNSNFFDNKDCVQVFQEYTYVFEDLTDLLERQICDEIESKPGDCFNPVIHQAKIEMTEEQSLDKTIKCSLSAGYKKDGKVLIPERVVVYQYNKTV